MATKLPYASPSFFAPQSGAGTSTSSFSPVLPGGTPNPNRPSLFVPPTAFPVKPGMIGNTSSNQYQWKKLWQYQPWAGWDVNKLNDPALGTCAKYDNNAPVCCEDDASNQRCVDGDGFCRISNDATCGHHGGACVTCSATSCVKGVCQ